MKRILNWLMLSLFSLFSGICYCQQWRPLTEEVFNPSGISPPYGKMFCHDSILFIPGGFETPFSDEGHYACLTYDSLNIGGWATWSGSASGIGKCIMEFEKSIFLGGSFTNLEGLAQADRIIRWDSTGFSEVGMGICGFTSRVEDMAVLGDKLYICGVLHDVGCIENVFWGYGASWNGAEYEAIGSALNDFAYRLAVYNGDLYVGGMFTHARQGNAFSNGGWYAASKIAKLNGNLWTNVGGGCNGTVMDMMVDTVANELVLGGFFTSCGGVQTSLVARWDGIEFKPVGNLVPGNVYTVEMYRGQLYAGGWHVLPGVHLAYFDGYDWQPVPGAYFNGIVKDLEVYKDELYVAGSYSQFNGEAVPGIMRYYLHSDSVQWGTARGVTEAIKGEEGMRVFPNPAGNQLMVAFTDGRSKIHRCTIADMSGREHWAGDLEVHNGEGRLDISALRKGEFVLVVRGDGNEVRSILFVKE